MENSALKVGTPPQTPFATYQNSKSSTKTIINGLKNFK